MNLSLNCGDLSSPDIVKPNLVSGNINFSSSDMVYSEPDYSDDDNAVLDLGCSVFTKILTSLPALLIKDSDCVTACDSVFKSIVYLLSCALGLDEFDDQEMIADLYGNLLSSFFKLINPINKDFIRAILLKDSKLDLTILSELEKKLSESQLVKELEKNILKDYSKFLLQDFFVQMVASVGVDYVISFSSNIIKYLFNLAYDQDKFHLDDLVESAQFGQTLLKSSIKGVFSIVGGIIGGNTGKVILGGVGSIVAGYSVDMFDNNETACAVAGCSVLVGAAGGALAVILVAGSIAAAPVYLAGAAIIAGAAVGYFITFGLYKLFNS